MHVHRTVRGITLVVLLTGVLAGVGFTVTNADDDSRRRGHSDRSRDDDSGSLARAWRQLEQFVVLRVGQLTAQVRELTTRMESLTQRANDTQRADDLLAKRIDDLTVRYNDLATRITTVDETIATVDRKIDAKVAELDVKVSGLDGRVTGQVSGLEGQIKTMSEGLASVTERVNGLASSGLAVLDSADPVAKVGDYVGMDSQGTLMIGMVVDDPVNRDRSYAFVLQLFPDRLVGNTIYFVEPGCAGQAYVAAGFPKPKSSLSLAGVREPGGIVYVSEANVSPGAAIQAMSSIPTASPHICVFHQFPLHVQVLPAKPLFALFALDPVTDFPQRRFVRPFVVK